MTSRRGAPALIVLAVILPALAAAILLANQETAVSRGPANREELSAAWEVVNDLETDQAALTAAETTGKAVLRREPLNANAASLLAAVMQREGRANEGQALATLAFRLNHREDFANLYLYRTALDRKDFEAAFLHADALLRRQYFFTEQLYPTMGVALNDPRAVPALAKRLVKRPDWRRNFMPAYIRSHPAPGGAYPLIAAIAAEGGEPTEDEIALYLTRLFQAGRYEEAYLALILFLPEERASALGYVYDGDFDDLPSARPFGWEYGVGAIDSAPGRSDDEGALYVRYDGDPGRRLPRQVLVLPQGRYRFSAELFTNAPPEAGTLRWTMACMSSSEPMMRTPWPQGGAWRTVTADFTVGAGCSAQLLSLEGIAAQGRGNLEVWYDKLKVEPVRSDNP